MTNLELYCATCGHHQADHLDDHGHLGPCGNWLIAGALVHVCTCLAFVSLRAVLQPQEVAA